MLPRKRERTSSRKDDTTPSGPSASSCTRPAGRFLTQPVTGYPRASAAAAAPTPPRVTASPAPVNEDVAPRALWLRPGKLRGVPSQGNDRRDDGENRSVVERNCGDRQGASAADAWTTWRTTRWAGSPRA